MKRCKILIDHVKVIKPILSQAFGSASVNPDALMLYCALAISFSCVGTTGLLAFKHIRNLSSSQTCRSPLRSPGGRPVASEHRHQADVASLELAGHGLGGAQRHQAWLLDRPALATEVQGEAG